jgi:hypothetical protein
MGSLCCKKPKYNPNIIDLKYENDINFAKIAQNSVVTGATLPSGLKIPKHGHWVIKGEKVINRKE